MSTGSNSSQHRSPKSAAPANLPLQRNGDTVHSKPAHNPAGMYVLFIILKRNKLTKTMLQ